MWIKPTLLLCNDPPFSVTSCPEIRRYKEAEKDCRSADLRSWLQMDTELQLWLLFAACTHCTCWSGIQHRFAPGEIAL
jgi:hypothetical protein